MTPTTRPNTDKAEKRSTGALDAALSPSVRKVGRLGFSSHTGRIIFASFGSWSSRAVAILSGLMLIPVLFRHLGKEELGVWLLLGQSWAVLGIFDLGLGPTLARRIALSKGRSGSDVSVPLSPESRAEIADLFFSGSMLFRLLALVTLGAAWISGYFYLQKLSLHDLSFQTALTAWTILCVGQAASVWTLGWTNLLIGLGYVGWETILFSATSVITIAVQIGVSMAGGGLLALAIIQALSSVVPRYLFRWFTRRYQPDLVALHGHWNWRLVKSMISPSLHCWVTTLGGMLVMQTDQFFVTQSKGVAQLPAYRAAYLLCINIQMLAVSVAPASAPFISQLWQARQREQAKQFALRNLRFGLTVVFCGIAALMTAGEDLFTIWLGPGHFSGYALIATFALVMIFETNGYIITTASRATEDEAYAVWSITAGVLKLAFSFILMRYFGLIGIAMGTLAAQLPTTYWYMTYRALKRLGISLREYLGSVFVPLIGVIALAFAGGWAVREALIGFNAAIRLGGVILVCALVLVASCWFLVFSAAHRRQLMIRLNASSESAGGTAA